MLKNAKVTVETPNVPGYTTTVDAEKYEVMKSILLTVLPVSPPGMTAEEMYAAMLPLLPEKFWPKGEKSVWWMKTVQLDLEAKGMLQREQVKPLRWYRLQV